MQRDNQHLDEKREIHTGNSKNHIGNPKNHETCETSLGLLADILERTIWSFN